MDPRARRPTRPPAPRPREHAVCNAARQRRSTRTAGTAPAPVAPTLAVPPVSPAADPAAGRHIDDDSPTTPPPRSRPLPRRFLQTRHAMTARPSSSRCSRSRSTTARSTGCATGARPSPSVTPLSRGEADLASARRSDRYARGRARRARARGAAPRRRSRARCASQGHGGRGEDVLGRVSSPRELQAMQADVEQLRRHRARPREPRARADGGS